MTINVRLPVSGNLQTGEPSVVKASVFRFSALREALWSLVSILLGALSTSSSVQNAPRFRYVCEDYKMTLLRKEE